MGKYFVVTNVSDSSGDDSIITGTKFLRNEVKTTLKSGFGSVWAGAEVTSAKRAEVETAIDETTNRLVFAFQRAGRELINDFESVDE